MKTLWKVIAGILAAVFAVGLFAASCCTAAVWGLSGAFTEKKIAAALEKVELAQLLGMGESDAITQTLMKSDAMKGLVSEYAGGAVGYLRGENKGDFALSASRKAALKEACMQVLKDSGISAQGGEAADSLEQVAGKMSDSLSASLPGYATVFSGINASTMSMLQGLLSVGARITFVVLMVLGCLLIMLVQWSPRRMLIWAGVPMALAGLLVVVGSWLSAAQLSAAVGGTAQQLADPLVALFCGAMRAAGLVILAVGAAFVIGFLCWKPKRPMRKRRPAPHGRPPQRRAAPQGARPVRPEAAGQRHTYE